MKRLADATAVCAVLGLAMSLAFAQPSSTQTAAAQVKVIEMTAKKYDYTPSEIRVKKGTRVQLKIRAIDRTHGFKIALYPEGAGESGAPGLKFDPQQENWKLAQNEERVIEFVAERAGSYPSSARCSAGLATRG